MNRFHPKLSALSSKGSAGWNFLRGALGLAVMTSVAAGGESIVLDFPLAAETSPSAQLTAPPRQLSRADGVGYTEIYLAAVPEGEGLAVTVVFEDEDEDGPALFWVDSASGQQTSLSADLSDRVVGLNQRTILVSPTLTTQAGRLVLSGNQARVKRVKLDWAAATQVLVSSDQAALRLVSLDRIYQSADLSGNQEFSPPDAWFGNVLEASLQNEPAALEGNVEFVVPLSRSVDQVLLKARFLGLPLDGTVKVWINGAEAGTLHPAIPSLSDPGYLSGSSGETEYSGWRDAGLLLPAALLTKGDNSIVLSSSTPSAFVRDATLQIKAQATALSTTEGIAIGETPDLAPH